jgi:hypothetical protein
MISLEDCIAICGLDPEEVAAIAEHEHVPAIEATAIGWELMHSRGGPARMRAILVDDLLAARRRGDLTHAAELLATLRQFLEEHPEAAQGLS